MNWKTCFLPLLLAAVMLGSVTAFADGEPATPETTEPTEITSEETAGSWKDNAYTDNQGIVYEWNENSITVTGTSTNFSGGSITIPATIKKGWISYPVTSVENRAFIFCDTLTAVTFSGDVDSIGDSAFFCCTALNTVTFSGDVDSIGNDAFNDCDALNTVTFSGDVDSIGDDAFWNCGALNTVTFSSSVDSIGDNAFQYCIALNTVTFFGGVDSIGYGAFQGCGALNTVTFSRDVGSIGDYAFDSCGALKTVTFSSNVGSIGYGAFWSCIALENVTFPGNVGSIGDNAFQHCTALNTVTFSGNVDSIGDYAFEGCDVLTTIYVPASMSNEEIKMIETALDRSGLQNVQIVQPEQPSDPDPDTPPDPSTGTPSAPSTGTTSTGSAVQQLEAAERPDPMDVEATERYNFWMDVKSDLRAAENGEKVRVYVPADYTNMPASVMETIRTLGKEITIDLRWNGQRLIITPQTALKRPARKAFWTFDALCEVYAR